ncbi:uncharacterized protein C7orf57-like isoform X2 [Narcine bancroftii]|uniref:uncharacterized protein C7orf57-like isoform X2 n=1 Tax=Narcine bancroftii TaxID=1343680 RepID=UPI003831695D
MSSSNQFSDCDWFYHIPQKPNKTGKGQVLLPPTSQIPGLSDLAEPHKEITFNSRRLWIRDTDSDYVKLAKKGGRTDLLRHYSPPLRKTSPVPSSQPEWFTHAPPSPKNKESKRILQDSEKTALGKEAEDNEKENERKVKLKLPEIMDKKKRNKWFSKKTVEGENKFPTMPLPKKNEPINFTKLMTNGYSDDWIQQRKEWKKMVPPKEKEPRDLVPLSKFQEELGKKELFRNPRSKGRKAFSTNVGQKVPFRGTASDPVAKPSVALNQFKDMPA